MAQDEHFDAIDAQGHVVLCLTRDADGSWSGPVTPSADGQLHIATLRLDDGTEQPLTVTR